MTARDPERDWIEFWEDICTTDTGDLDIAQIKRELSDFKMVMGQVALVYDHITGGRITKPSTEAQMVIAVADDEFDERLNEALEAVQKAH